MKKVRPFVWLSEDWVIRLSVVTFRNAVVDIGSYHFKGDMFDVIANRGQVWRMALNTFLTVIGIWL